MKLNAYVLLADPTWLRESVLAYYHRVDRIVASYDETSRGWTGAPVRTNECLAALRAIDREGKVDYRPGRFANIAANPMEADTVQRSIALAAASEDADWVLQLDTDEVLPSLAALERFLRLASDRGVDAVEWPMRVLYRALRHGRYLQVMDSAEHIHFDYPGPVAVRAGTRLHSARTTQGSFIRPTVPGHDQSLQVVRPPGPGEIRIAGVDSSEAIWHNSWARPVLSTTRKVASWGHRDGLNSVAYLARRWLVSPLTWRSARNWHPFAEGLWPELGIVDELPFAFHPADDAA